MKVPNWLKTLGFILSGAFVMVLGFLQFRKREVIKTKIKVEHIKDPEDEEEADNITDAIDDLYD